MKRIVCLFILTMPLALFAQTGEVPAVAFVHHDSLGKPIPLPKLRRGEYPHFFEAGTKGEYVYMLADSSEYYTLFKQFAKEQLPAIDFSASELLLVIDCAQCLAHCNHQGKENEPCHRNACNYTYNWFLRDKKRQ